MKQIALPTNWTVQPVGESSQAPPEITAQNIPATVPGCVHTDLLAAGLIPDPYLDRNEDLVQWIGHTDWQYRCAFDLAEADLVHDRLELACDGLDTLATVELNGTAIGESQDMHTRQRFDAKAAARVGENELVVTFAAALPHAEAEMQRLGNLPKQGGGSNPQHPHNFIRKMACNFGWDWGPVLVTAGIWRDIRLEAWDTVRIADVRPVTKRIDHNRTATLKVYTDLERAEPGDLTLRAELSRGGGTHSWTSTLIGHRVSDPITFSINHAELWWPVGHGEQPRYDLQVWIEDAAGQRLDERTHRVGLRTTELFTEPDPKDELPGAVENTLPGSAMTLKVNGKPIFCKGANWIPDDCFPHRVTPARVRQRIEQARDTHMNMLRVWGGGTYESEAFYDVCDELGIMVWQDFLCACAAYSEEEPLASLIESEARDNVARLVRHPSLVLFNGGNECIWGYHEWTTDGKKWPESIGDRGWGEKYFHHVFPDAVEQLAPGMPYWPNSPYSAPAPAPGSQSQDHANPEPNANEHGNRHIWDVWFGNSEPNANQHGNRHIWDVWHGPGQYRNYLAHFPRFASEFGFHGPPTWANIQRSIPQDQWTWNSDCMNAHNKNSSDSPGQAQTHLRMGDDFDPPAGNTPEDFNDWLYLAQIGQARALEMGITWFRALAPYCSGTLYWQFNDCWPVSSWSAIDSDGKPKPLYHASRRFFAPRLLTLKPRAVNRSGESLGKLALYTHNDTDEPWTGVVRLELMDMAGSKIHAAQGVQINIPPRTNGRFDIADAWHDDTAQRFIAATFIPPTDNTVEASQEAPPAFWWFSADKEYDYPEANFDAALEQNAEESCYYLTITANSLLRDVCVFADRLDADAEVSDQCVTLLPGQTHEFVIRSDADLTLADLTAPPVLQVANRFGRVAVPT